MSMPSLFKSVESHLWSAISRCKARPTRSDDEVNGVWPIRPGHYPGLDRPNIIRDDCSLVNLPFPLALLFQDLAEDRA